MTSPYSIYLASQSPRRSDLLTHAGIPFTRVHSGFDEADHRGKISDPKEYVIANAIHKGRWVAENSEFRKGIRGPSIVVSADTIVVLGSNILEKPVHEAEAVTMLASLSGKKHTVLTGLCFHFILPSIPQARMLAEVFTTDVHFRSLSESEIRTYVDSGEPMDKSGAYVWTGKASCFVKSIQGSWTNVIGLPLAETVEWLQDAEKIFQQMR